MWGDLVPCEWYRIIRITPCVFDEMHTGALFRVFSKSCFFLRDSQNPATNLPPKCIWGSFVQVLMHTAALFKRQTWQLAHGRLTQFHGVCIWACAARSLSVTFHRGHVVTSSSGTTLTIARLHVCIFFRNVSGFPVWMPVVQHNCTFLFYVEFFFRHSSSFQTTTRPQPSQH